MSYPILLSRQLSHAARPPPSMKMMSTLFRPSISFVRRRRWHPLVHSKSCVISRYYGIVATCVSAHHEIFLRGRSGLPNLHRWQIRQRTRYQFSSVSTIHEKSEEDAIDGDCRQSDNVAEVTFTTTSEALASTDVDTQSWDGVNVNLDNADQSTSTLESPGEKTPATLSDLLKTDIFTESWREVEKTKSTPTLTSSNSALHPSSAKRKDEHTHKVHSLIEYPTRPVEVRYNELLQQTNDILERLFDVHQNDSSSTLQLMDFDKIMVQWSQFHSEIDRHHGRNDNKFDTFDDVHHDFTKRRGFTTDQVLLQNASDNCMTLLHALEDNYDVIYEYYLRSKGDSIIHNHTGLDNTSSLKHTKLFPNAASYNLALHALANSSKGALVATEAYFILNRMLDRCQQYRDAMEESSSSAAAGIESSSSAPLPPLAPPEPNIITYNSVIHAIAKSGASEAGFYSESVFARMESWKEECDERNSKLRETRNGRDSPRELYRGVLPNARTLACVLDAWANSKSVHGESLVPERTTAILEVALEKRREYVRSVRGERAESYSFEMGEEEDDIGHVEDIKQFSGIDDIVEEKRESESIDDEIDENLDSELLNDQVSSSAVPLTTLQTPNCSTVEAEPFLRPNIVSFNTVLHAWSMSKRGRQGALRAHELLDKVERLSQSGDLDLPDGHPDPTVSSLDIDDETLGTDSSLRPNGRSYSIVMNAWANVSHADRDHGEDAASKCEMILNKMEERGAEDASVRPNLAAYTTCITAWARAKHDQAASRAENILHRMIDLYYDKGKNELPALEGDLENAQHDAPFNAVITAYARSADPNASDRAFAVLERLEASPILPTATTYNSVMDACAKHGEPERALWILERMQEKSIRPDPTSYDTILNAFARDETAGSAERAWEFLLRLEDERMNGKSDFVPTNISYSSVINAFARASGRKEGGIHVAEKAKEVYDKMIHLIETGKLFGNADPYANSCFINCCANVNGPSSEKRTALIMAINAFEEMKKNTNVHGEPNQYTFGTMMKACIKLSSDPGEKIRLLESLFVQACNRGYLSSSVLGQFVRNTPSHVSAKAILAQGGSKRDLPEKWYRHVHQKDWPRAMSRRDESYRNITQRHTY
ncbi:hypothetical protein ACHAW6_004373 [Cyclotella cf. meneghiniana]